MTKPARQPQHCDHECVCMGMPNFYEVDESCTKDKCKHDTRTHSSQPVPEVSAVDRFNRAMISGQTISKEVDVGISFSAQELTKRDAAIRKAERERVLDELVKKVDAGMPSVSADRFRAGLKTAYGNVYLWIESLRGGGTP